MKRLLLTPNIQTFKKRAYLTSLNQNTCPLYDAENKNNKLLKSYIHKKKGVSFAPVKKRDNPHHQAFLKIIALYIAFVSNKN